MRGKPKPAPTMPLPSRNIPAYAGKTRTCLRPPRCTAEHPRVCGENDGKMIAECDLTGTSPRMRGKHGLRRVRFLHQRNIPAYAGKTCFRFASSRTTSEHPRVCGENGEFSPSVSQRPGTSPRMRGKPRKISLLQLSSRNIPAYAGKTLIDVRFLVPEGYFTFGFVFLHGGGSMESP